MIDIIEFKRLLEEQGVYAGESTREVYDLVDLKAFSYAVQDLREELSNPILELQDQKKIEILRSEIAKALTIAKEIIAKNSEKDAEYIQFRKSIVAEYDQKVYPKILDLVSAIDEFLAHTNGLKGEHTHEYSGVMILREHLADGMVK